ncbi:MAG: chemotaxis protein CheA, partial [Microcoleaceae cyanobacterium]
PPPPSEAIAEVVPVTLNLKPKEQEELRKVLGQGWQAWHFLFAPKRELSQRGINVNVIRAKLQSVGQLIHSSPCMLTPTDIAFNFVIATQNITETTFTGWGNDGLVWQPYLSVVINPPDTLPLPVMPPVSDQIPLVIPPAITEENIAMPPSDLPVPIEAIALEKVALEKITPAKTEKNGNSQIANNINNNANNNSEAPLITQPSNVVRVDLPRLDELMRMVGDLVISRARLEEQIKRLPGSLPPPQIRSLQEVNLSLERQLRDLREGVMRVRLVPIGEIFARMQFVIRELVRDSLAKNTAGLGKDVKLELVGQETEIDKFIVERMMDPLLHLVRNAFSHGIETMAERQAQGKNPVGKITLRAGTIGEMVMIEVTDDGHGIDREKIWERAKQQGLLEENQKYSDHDFAEILNILASPGFSTKETADMTSGRGVGMAIVKNTVQELGGIFTVTSHPGVGTAFTIHLPLTLAIADALIVNVGEQTFAIPQTAVREVMVIDSVEITKLENNEIILYRDQVLPLLRLTEIFNIKSGEDQSDDHSTNITVLDRLKIVVVGNGLSAVGIMVNRIIGQREIVVRSLTDPLVQVMGVTGATELGDGKVVLILDVNALTQNSKKVGQSGKNITGAIVQPKNMKLSQR